MKINRKLNVKIKDMTEEQRRQYNKFIVKKRKEFFAGFIPYRKTREDMNKEEIEKLDMDHKIKMARYKNIVRGYLENKKGER